MSETTSAILNKVATVIINPIIIFGFLVALLYFFWGIFQFVRSSAGDQKGLDQGKRSIVWGLVGMFIMIGVFGIIRIILNSFGLDTAVNENDYLDSLIN